MLRNLPRETPTAVSDLIAVQSGRVVSMALSKTENCQMTLFAFAAGESVSQEYYFGDTLYMVIEGEMPIYMNEKKLVIAAGECLAVEAGVLHAIGGEGAFKLLQMTLQ